VERSELNLLPRPRLGWLLTAIAAALIVGAVLLGRWQLQRAEQKAQLQEEYARGAEFAPVTLSGERFPQQSLHLRRLIVRGKFEPDKVIYLDGKIRHGVAGYYVVMPLRIEGGSNYLLVNRGWARATDDRDKLPAIRTDAESVIVSGTAIAPPAKLFELSQRGYEGVIWPHLKIDLVRSRFSISVLPVVLQQENVAEDGLLREWPSPDFGIDRHYGYAFQWFSLALTVLIAYGVFHARSRRR
jgi:surfeit locus 1 family protein